MFEKLLTVLAIKRRDGSCPADHQGNKEKAGHTEKAVEVEVVGLTVEGLAGDG
jgi:hypothetical protein